MKCVVEVDLRINVHVCEESGNTDTLENGRLAYSLWNSKNIPQFVEHLKGTRLEWARPRETSK